jgi:hypothetical protein
MYSNRSDSLKYLPCGKIKIISMLEIWAILQITDTVALLNIAKQEINKFSWQYNKNARFLSNFKAFFLLQNGVILKCTAGTEVGRTVLEDNK